MSKTILIVKDNELGGHVRTSALHECRKMLGERPKCSHRL